MGSQFLMIEFIYSQAKQLLTIVVVYILYNVRALVYFCKSLGSRNQVENLQFTFNFNRFLQL